VAFVGIDLGTGSTKVAVVAGDGRVLGQNSCAHIVRSPEPGAAETHPRDWLASVEAAARGALASAGRPAVDAIGLSGQMHGVVCVDDDGAVLRPALLWADVRAGAACSAYDQLDVADRTALANPVVAGMFGPLLAWALARDPGIRRRLRWALPPKDWLRLVLTGDAHTEPSDASATLLWDMPASRWSAAAIDALDLPAGALPPIVESGRVAGELSSSGAELLGLPVGTPVAAGAADVAAAISGTGLGTGDTGGARDAQLSVGTGAQLVVPVAELHLSPDPVTHRYRRADPSGWYAMAAVQNAGLALEWVRDVLHATWDEMHAALDQVPPGADGVTFHGYLTGERTPLLDTDVRGAWQGLSLHTSRPALLRAALEGVAFAVRDGLEALTAEGVDVGDVRLVGGGTTDIRWRRLLAGALGRPLVVHDLPDVSVIGATRLAASAIGATLPPSTSATPTVVEPSPDAVAPLEDAWRRWRARPPRARPPQARD
jgi:xylulokinase